MFRSLHKFELGMKVSIASTSDLINQAQGYNCSAYCYNSQQFPSQWFAPYCPSWMLEAGDWRVGKEGTFIVSHAS
jgi:hypothetical protein